MQDARPIYKNQLYFYTLAINNPTMKLGKVSFITASKIKIYLKIGVTKEVQSVYSINYKTF